MLIRSITLVTIAFSFIIVSHAGAQNSAQGERVASINEGTTTEPTQTNYHYPRFDQSTQVPNNPWSSDRMEMGIGLAGINYWGEGILFTDVMKSSSIMKVYALNVDKWEHGNPDSIPRDEKGWPLEIPTVVWNDSSAMYDSLSVKIMINNQYIGRYVITWEGEGDFDIRGLNRSEYSFENDNPNKAYITFNGNGGHVWLEFKRSIKGNHIRNMKIIPVEYEGVSDYPTFNPDYIRGLAPFTTLRYKDLQEIDHSIQSEWSDRTTPEYYTQATYSGMAIEYIVELANLTNTDPWVNMPHMATDEYIENFAKMIRDGLKPGLKVYVEYSNEVWNWGYAQSHYPVAIVQQSADSVRRMTVEPHVIAGLNGVADRYCPGDRKCFPETNAWMMARVFKIWDKVFEGQRNRVVMVAAVQSAWVGNTGSILRFLTEDPEGYKPDAVAGGGYFNFSRAQHEVWNAMNPADVTPEMILDSVDAIYESDAGKYLDGTVDYVREFGVEYIIYEGGQHMQPQDQQDWGYNQAVYDAQIHPKMYDLYMRNFQRHYDAGTKLFVAFDYIRPRETKYGSWGHLENVQQTSLSNWMDVAPKYQALVDAAELYKGETSTSEPDNGGEPGGETDGGEIVQPEVDGETAPIKLNGISKPGAVVGQLKLTDLEEMVEQSSRVALYDIKGTVYTLDYMTLQMMPSGAYVVMHDDKAYRYIHR